MTNRGLKVVAAVAASLVLALVAGYFWGASGRRAAEARVQQLESVQWLADARARLLAGQVDLHALNFGSAARHFEAAKVPLDRLATHYAGDGNAAAAEAVRGALTATEEARASAAQLDPGAQAAAQRAFGAVSELHPHWN